MSFYPTRFRSRTTEARHCYNRLISDVLSLLVTLAFASAHSLLVIDIVFLWPPQLQFVSGRAQIYFISSTDKLQSLSVFLNVSLADLLLTRRNFHIALVF